jgi:AraC family transcriptional regulator
MLVEEPLKVDFAKEQLAGYQRIYSRSPQLTSLAAGWQGIYFGADYLPPGETPEVIAQQHCIAIFTDFPQAVWADRTLDGCRRQEQVVTGDIVIAPANVGCRSRWTDAGTVIFFCFDPALMAHALPDAIAPDRVTLLPQFATADPLVHQMGLALKAVLEQYGTASRLYGETMATALIVHLLQHYAAQRPTLRDYTGLSKQCLQQVVDYIQAHLDRDLSLFELATIAQMSAHYFAQLFKQSTGLTPHQYVIRARVERAQQLLTQTNLTIAEVARRVGFADQSHLNRHCKRQLGLTPKMLQRSH